MARSMTSTLDKLKAAGKLDNLGPKQTTGENGQAAIDIARIEPDPDQPRRSFNQDKLEALSASIAVHGVLQPITVQPANANGTHLVIMGERRLRAAKMAGLTAIPAIVREVTSELRSIQVTENIHRDDLTTMEIALAVEQMRKDGMKRPEIAKTLGWGQAQVSQFSGVLSMPEELKGLASENVPVRALSDLNVLWKQDEQAARDFVDATQPDEITRVTVAALRSDIDAGQEGRAADVSPKPRPTKEQVQLPASESETKPSERKVARNSLSGQVAILCKRGEEVGRILTDRKAKSNKALMVSFANGERIEEVALTDIVLLEVIEL